MNRRTKFLLLFTLGSFLTCGSATLAIYNALMGDVVLSIVCLIVFFLASLSSMIAFNGCS